MNVDRLLAVFISLGYDLDLIQTLFRRFQVPKLYVRNVRDYQIAVGIKARKSLTEIDEVLDSKNLGLISQYANSEGN